MKAILVTALACLLLAGCTSTPAVKEQFAALPERAGYTRLYVYREKKLVGMAARPTITMDGVDVGPLKNGTFLAFYLPAGTHEIKADFSILFAPLKGSKATISVAEDQEYYLRFNIQIDALIATKHIVYSEWETAFDVPDIEQSRLLIAPLEPGTLQPEAVMKQRADRVGK